MSYCVCRLQPSAVVTDEQCAACDFNKPGKTCLRSMEWVWRGEHYSATSAEYNSIKAQLASESFPPAVAGGPVRSAALPFGLSSPISICFTLVFICFTHIFICFTLTFVCIAVICPQISLFRCPPASV